MSQNPLFNGQDSSKKSPEWVGFHVYFTGSLNKLLHEAIRHILQFLESQFLIENYFFIKYGEGGPHIRFRVRLKPDDKIILFIKEELELFLSKQKLPLVEASNNFVLVTKYDQEFERYGGYIGMGIAETLFEMSSRAFMKILDVSPNLNYSEVLMISIQMHLGFLYGMEFAIIEAQNILMLFVSHWIGFNQVRFNSTIENNGFKDQEAIQKEFQKKFLSQEAILVPIVEKTWLDLKNNNFSNTSWLSEWLQDVRLVRNLYAEKKDELIYPQKTIANQLYKPIWDIYLSLMHMTNNRCGVMNFDESYVAYIIAQALQICKTNLEC
jgi:thiopeptide-type bacteriocin biosynthesis protein